MTPETEQQYKNQIAALQAEIEKLKNQQTKAIQREKYGLNWIDVPEEFDKKSKNSIPVLKEIKEKSIKNNDGKPTHILIEGDNYHALTCLNYTHAGKIDVIYIDPPYNTGSDGFTYKDARFMTEFPNGKTVPKDDPLRHSTWLSFMGKRLRLAKNLLSDKGVIFISIDDNEQANLKLLCDQIFGEKNFVADFCVIRAEGGGMAKQVIKGHDYCLVYASNITKFIPLAKAKDIRGKIIEQNGIKYWIQEDWLRKEFGKYGNCHYEELIEYKGESFKKEIDEGIKNNIYVLIPKDNGLTVIGKLRRLDTDSSKFYSVLKHLNKNGVNELKELCIDFDYPKSIALVEELVSGATFFNKSSTILDFFAGSGTTLHATMKLNAEDGGNRQCILVQQKENDANICETITYERNRRVMQGYTNAKGEEIAGLGNSLKYYKTDFIGENDAEKAGDEDKITLAQKAGYLISLEENTLEEIETNDFYQIFSDAEENQFTAIYFNGDTEKFPDFVQSIQEKNKKTIVYIFTWGSPDIFENEFDDLSNITIKSIPQPILEIYKSLMKNGE